MVDNITDENRAKALQALREFSTQLPRAAAPRRLALSVATGTPAQPHGTRPADRSAGDEFKELAEPYLAAGLRKNIPSLFADIKSLYRDPAKLATIAALAEAHLAALAPPAPGADAEPPTTYLWTLYFLAQHHSCVGDHARALALLDTALAHTPTLPDLLMFRARVLKRLGDPFGAARCMDEARVLDLQDRFLNTKCGKYRLRAGMVDEAQEVFGLFTKVRVACDRLCCAAAECGAFGLERRAEPRCGPRGHAVRALPPRGRGCAPAERQPRSRAEAVHGRPEAFQRVRGRPVRLPRVLAAQVHDQHLPEVRSARIHDIAGADACRSMIQWADNLRSHPAYVRAAIAASQVRKPV